MLLKYKSSPVGPYNELAYIPGKYKAGKCSTPLFSVQRIWVDSEASVQGGRSNWGLPKVRAGCCTALMLVDASRRCSSPLVL